MCRPPRLPPAARPAKPPVSASTASTDARSTMPPVRASVCSYDFSYVAFVARASAVPEVREAYGWKAVLWSASYCAVSAGGAPLEVLKRYIEGQKRPEEGRPCPEAWWWTPACYERGGGLLFFGQGATWLLVQQIKSATCLQRASGDPLGTAVATPGESARDVRCSARCLRTRRAQLPYLSLAASSEASW
jgi:hypothetical protein